MEPVDPLQKHSLKPAELKALIALRKAQRPFLAWRDGEGPLKLQPLDELGVQGATIGRSPKATVSLSQSEVSILHAQVTSLADHWVIDDLGSANGTSVEGRRISTRRRLRHDDKIIVGDTMIRYECGYEPLPTTVKSGQRVRRNDVTGAKRAVLKALCRPMILEQAEEPATNEEIAEEAHMTVWGAKAALGRLFIQFGVKENPKRRRLAKLAIANGIVTKDDYSE